MMEQDQAKWPRRAAIFGASGGIGAAIARLLADRGVPVLGGSRSGAVPRHHLVSPFSFDLTDEASIAAAAATLAVDMPDLVLVATGALTLADGTAPERSLKSLDPASLAQSLAVNTIGPAMIAKHVLPLFPRDARWTFAVLSAKVGSISDNQAGGWHSYRAGKAALNMLVKNMAIEMARTHPQGTVLALHPGTVDTALSAPFQRNVPEGQLKKRREAACALVDVMCRVTPAQSGQLIGWDGQEIAP
jgi:NAD(P)-dependent dehydrogenase (short-subunit alcohol dehydrogenase family)